MKVGVVKEIKDMENRVALTPGGAKTLISAGNEVLMENNAGLNSGFENNEYSDAGAQIVDTEKAWSADIVIKVKEPLEQEYKFLRENQIVFTYLHLACVPYFFLSSSFLPIIISYILFNSEINNIKTFVKLGSGETPLYVEAQKTSKHYMLYVGYRNSPEPKTNTKNSK